MKFRLVILMLAAVSAASLGGCGKKGPKAAGDVEFSARMTDVEDGATTRYAINFTRDSQRLTVLPEGSGGVVIIRHDSGVVWALMPSMTMYLEMPEKPENKNPLVYEPDEISRWQKLGEETVDGHPAIKEKLTFRNKGDDEKTIYRWFAKDIGWPVKAEAADGSWSTSFTDIHLERQDPSLFEPPRAYMKVVRQPARH